MARAPRKTANKEATEQPQMAALTEEEQNQLLHALQEATQNGGFLYVSDEHIQPLIDAGLAEVNPDDSQRDEHGRRMARATIQQATEVREDPALPMNEQPEAQPQQEARKMSNFAIEKNVPLPTTTTAGRGRGSLYPFDDLEVGDSFFVPQVDGKPESMSSTVAGARRRFAEQTGNMTQDKNGNEVPEMRVTRNFVYKLVDENGVTGFRVWRSQ